MSSINNPPKRVFIVPYRDRIPQKFFFCKQMEFILEEQNDYEIIFVHQCDSRNFNRGAMKNIGFLAVKEKYPEYYKDISFIFNDVDTLPFHKLFDYETTEGVVKHHYGFETALGGILVIKGSDFELINGYPNYWGWGMEDACLQKRCFAYGIQIDRSNFYPIGSPEILQLFDGVSRLVSRRDPQRMKTDNGQDGIRTIHKLMFSLDKESLNPADNKYVVESEKIFVANVSTFMTMVHFGSDAYHEYDLREPVSKVVFPDKESTDKTHISSEEWKNIPHNSVDQDRMFAMQQQMQPKTPQLPPNINVFSANYARLIGVKPKASKSANIGLGGIIYR
jgi:N-terminal region of glycosyl transferase group 7